MQGSNRYSYVGNDPLAFTDPNGFNWFSSFFGGIFEFLAKPIRSLFQQVPILASIVQIATTIALTPFIGPFAAAAVGATFVTGLSGGSLSQALRAGAIAAATARRSCIQRWRPCTGRLRASSVASGGTCKSGALSAGVSAAAAPFMGGMNGTQKLVASAVLGGAASVAGGGKFANGAVTGAFGYMFNAAMGYAVGGRIGAFAGAALFSESGPGAIAGAIFGRLLFGSIGSALEDWLISPSASEDGGRYSGRYADGEKAYRTNVPRDGNNNPLPDPDADGPHSRLQMDARNPSRIYSATEFNQEQTVKRIDFAGRPGDELPHQHMYNPDIQSFGPKGPLSGP